MKTKKALFITTLLLAIIGCKNTTTPPSIAVKSCEKTILNYIKFRDNGPIKDYQALFTQDATFNIPKLNVSLSSNKQIADRAAQAMLSNKTIHMITSMHIEPNSMNTLSSTAHFILYMIDKKDKQKTTKIFNGRYVDSLLLDNGRCFIQTRKVLIDRMDTLGHIDL
ncbi:hypothetical protein PSECIP111951_02507 [Pseudoalteromonas holothuriae]|uniref:SnoaL-like domain-containing protein n=1 Tax=Pseudoalteromonas holothuriae TaxID=2963714 RepID=A0ABM9GJN8_9GAMM|nr:nuclear transport factor 2 family protein [Pseudoalteromonas sp. CIP111951]CAH9061524.1 hypothetical protein PSECIP111951_02507 [Pseudoalteromonas sp. CIP111951]